MKITKKALAQLNIKEPLIATVTVVVPAKDGRKPYVDILVKAEFEPTHHIAVGDVYVISPTGDVTFKERAEVTESEAPESTGLKGCAARPSLF